MAADPNDPTRQAGESDESFVQRTLATSEGLLDAATTSGKILKLTTQNINEYGLAINTASRAIETMALKAADAAIDVYRVATTRLEDVSQATVQVQAMLQSVTGLNAISLASTEYGVDTVAKKLSDSAYKSVQDLSKAQVQLTDGTKLSAVAFIKSSEELLRDYTNVVLNDRRLFNAGVEGMSFDLNKSVKFTMDALRLQSDELNEIFQIELSNTGKITGEQLEKFNKVVFATARASGQVPGMVAQDIAAMMKDFAHFGAMTETQMGNLSAMMSKLGMNVRDVTSLADRFANFDTAADTMSKLAASTGATLDTLELFRLANEDQGAFIEELRNQLESQGVEFENMNIIQQKQIASAFGIDPRMLQRLLNDNFSTIESLTEDIEKRAGDITKGEVDSLLASMNSMADQAKALTATEIQHRITTMQAASADYAKTIEHSYRTTVGIVQQVVDDMGGARDQALNATIQLRQQLEGLNNDIDQMLGNRSGSRGGAAAAAGATTNAASVATANAEAAARAAQEAAVGGPTSPAPPAPPAPPTSPGTPPPPASVPAPTGGPPPAPITVFPEVTAEELEAQKQAGASGSVAIAPIYGSASSASAAASSASPAASTPAAAADRPTASQTATTATTQTVNVVLKFEGSDEFTNVLAKNILTKGANGIDLEMGQGELKLVFSTNTTSQAPITMP